MPRIGDYSIIREQASALAGLGEIVWTLPPSLDRPSRSILGFILRLADIDDWLTLHVHINGHSTYNRKFTSGFYGTIIQVVKKNHLLHGENVITFEFDAADSDLRVVAKIASVVLWWQANI